MILTIEMWPAIVDFIKELDHKHKKSARRNTLCRSCYVPHPCSIRVALDELLNGEGR